MDCFKKYDIVRMKKGQLTKEQDIVITEYHLTVVVNGQELIALMCTPRSLESLLVGYLFTEGIIDSFEDISDIQIDEKQARAYVNTKNKDIYYYECEKLNAKKTITTACGRHRTIMYGVMGFMGTDTDKIKQQIDIHPELILQLMKEFNKKSELFLQTGGVHSCALCSTDGILIYEEDVGRHNAIDKVLGTSLTDHINLSNKMVLSSGRISSEMITKIARSKIPVLISRSAPTDAAVDMARALNVTLIGFARGEKLNIYSNINNYK